MHSNNTATIQPLLPHEVDVVIYHHPCSDGTGSAYVAWKYFKQHFPNKQINYIPMSYSYDTPQNLEGKNVLICDFSFKKNILNELLKKVNKLLIIDHHISAQKDLEEIDNNYKIFDMNKSGAMLTWNYFFPNITAPLMIQYIQDRDIWTRQLPNNDEFAAWFHTLPLEFEEYDKYYDDNVLLQMIDIKGKAYCELNNYYINQALDHVAIKFIEMDGQYYFIVQVNYNILKSDIGNVAILKYPLADFSAVYSISDRTNTTSFSFRSTNKNLDVSELASKLDGGGHRNASGASSNKVTNIFLDGHHTIHQGGELSNSMYLYKQLQTIECNVLCLNGNQINIVYIYSDFHQQELGQYLLQTRYKTPDQYNVQACNDILMKQKKDCHKETQVAIVTSYDEKNDITKFAIICKSKDVEELLKKYINYGFNNEFVTKGRYSTFPLDNFLFI